MSGLFAPVDPFASGTLQVGDGHTLYWERCGARGGIPAVFLHGGPGSGCSANQRRMFDPSRFDVVLFDQRGAGRSRPLASESPVDLSTNTTAALVDDLEQLRATMGFERWMVVGMSWGTTLALAYAEDHPTRVTGLLLGLVTTTSRREVEWITVEMGRIFPDAWERFSSAVPAHLGHLPLVKAYARLTSDPDPAVHVPAAEAWCAWEATHVSLVPQPPAHPRFEDPEYRLRFSRLVTHYWSHGAFLADNQLLDNAVVLNGVPGVLINGRYDVSGPLESAWRLSKSWTTSRLEVVDDAGHGGGAFLDAVLSGLTELADTVSPHDVG